MVGNDAGGDLVAFYVPMTLSGRTIEGPVEIDMVLSCIIRHQWREAKAACVIRQHDTFDPFVPEI